MKLNIIQLAKVAKCTALLLLAGAVWSCSSKDEVEEMLSTETTPVTFQVDAQTTPIFFDFTEGWRYIGSDTVKSASYKASAITLDLRQGKHNIVAVKGIETSNDVQKTGVHFDPSNRTFYLQSEYDAHGLEAETAMLGVPSADVCYWRRQLEVSPYLLPEQKPEYTPVTATLYIGPQSVVPAEIQKDMRVVGTYIKTEVKEVPVVEQVGLDSKSYKLRKTPHEIYAVLSESGSSGLSYSTNGPYITLCPEGGLHDISLTISVSAEVTMSDGFFQHPYRRDYTVRLPKFSLQRGYVTRLMGATLYSEKTEDWTVEMAPYEQ